MALESIPAYSGFRSGPAGQAYNEAAFRYFLDADRRRVERSGRSIILVLASIRPSPGRTALLSDRVAAALFAGLAAGVREVDFIGWYREGRIAGAVLPQAIAPSRELRDLVGRRIFSSLEKCLSADRARHLHVRVVRLDGKDQR